MSDLKVTDLQKIIRTFADNGHDITQSPRHVHVDGKPYGMVIGHDMYIKPPNAPKGAKPSFLNSYVMQSEKPLVSHIKSGQVMPKNLLVDGDSEPALFHPQRSVNALARFQYKRPGHSDTYGYDDLDDELATQNTDKVSWLGFHDDTQDKQGLWVPHPSSGYKDIHEAIQSHTSIPHHGLLTDESSGRIGLRLMTPKEHSSFDEHRALSSLIGVKPFSGLVHVLDSSTLHSPDISTYTYNLQTEELHKHDS